MNTTRGFWGGFWILVGLAVGGPVFGQDDGDARVREALSYKPKQTDVEYDQPEEAAIGKCKLESAKVLGKVGFIVKDDLGRILRLYVDSNGDKKLDRWSYFKDNQEVYCDIDADYDGKAEQFRWFGTGGTRWGVDGNDDHIVDTWRVISAEEVSAELVTAIREQDARRFQALLITPQEIGGLKLAEDLAAELKQSVADAQAGFTQFAKSQGVVNTHSRWIQFGGIRPSVIADSTPGVPEPLTIYDNVATIVSGDKEPVQIAIGTLIKIGETWRITEMPQVIKPGEPIAVGGLFHRSGSIAAATPAAMTGEGGDSKIVEDYLATLKEIDTAPAAQLPALYDKLAGLIRQIIDSESGDEEKSIWIKQYADIVSTAFLDDKFPTGLDRLTEFSQELAAAKTDEDAIGYVEYRLIAARTSHDLAEASDKEIDAVHGAMLTALESFIDKYPKSEFASEAMYQLATSAEMNDPDAAAKWYTRIVKEFPESPFLERSRGAFLRLNSRGRTLPIEGPTVDGKKLAINQLKGKTVILHYWASWAGTHDIDELRRLKRKYETDGLEIVSICVDEPTIADKTASFLKENSMPWIQLNDGKGLQGGLAERLGITMVPTTILIGGDGLVVDPRARVEELDATLRKRLKGEDEPVKEARKN